MLIVQEIAVGESCDCAEHELIFKNAYNLVCMYNLYLFGYIVLYIVT